MKIVAAYPPNYDRIAAVFDLSNESPCFTYGDTLYNPGGEPIPAPLMAHEEVHAARQVDPQAWWDRYLTDPAFRLAEELLGYQAQYREAKKLIKNREELAQYLTYLAFSLSGAMYGHIISLPEARKRISQ